MDKLHGYGFDLNTLAWIYSYLTNRKFKQHDVVDGSASSDMHINMLHSKVGISNLLFFRVMGAKGKQIHQIFTCLPEQNQLIQWKYHSR